MPQKNIRPILGMPLIAYTIEEAKKSQYLTRYIVSTDSPQIQKVATLYGAEAPFLRPGVHANDTASSVSALQHAVEWIENQEERRYDIVVEIMCTNPLKTSDDIDSCIRKLIDTAADSVIAVHRIEDHHPARIKQIVDDKIVDFCVKETPETRRQDLTPYAYVRSGSIYAMQRDHLMLDGRRYGSRNSRPYVLPEERTINIDTEIDFLIAEAIIKKKVGHLERGDFTNGQ